MVHKKTVPKRHEISRMGLVNLLAFLFLKLLYNLVSMQTQIIADVSKILKNFLHYLTFILDVLLESVIDFVS